MKKIAFFRIALPISIFSCLVAALFLVACHSTEKPIDTKQCVGKYESHGMVVQVTMVNEKLSLIVPGAPVQELIPEGTNKYKSSTMGEEVFEFVEKDGKVTEMISRRGGQSLHLKKIADTADDFNKNDSLPVL